jgi:type IV secretory pathway TrbF-like protein
VKSTDHWKGLFTIALNAPTEEQQARINPLGLYVTAASWAKVL